MSASFVYLVLATLLAGPRSSHQEHSHPNAGNKEAVTQEKPVPPPPAVVDPSSSAPHAQAESRNEQPAPQSKTLLWFIRPEWVIAWITAIYTGVATWTLFSIKRQADLMEIQARLQAAAMKQWIEVSILKLEDQGRTRNSVGEVLPSKKIRVWIQAKNTSPHALTMQIITALITIRETENVFYFECREAMPVAPSGAKGDRYSLPIPLNLTDQMMDDYRSGSLTFPITGMISFDSSVGPPNKQLYALSVLCNNRAIMEQPLVAEMRRKELPPETNAEDHKPN